MDFKKYRKFLIALIVPVFFGLQVMLGVDVSFWVDVLVSAATAAGVYQVPNDA